MENQLPNDDADHFDGVFIRYGPPPSVFYRGRRPLPKHSCKSSRDLAVEYEAERLKRDENRKQRKRRYERKPSRRKRNWSINQW
jgi:hypothetical protein